MEIEIKLSNLHPNQQKVKDESKRFNVLCCGRRWGKSELAIDLLCDSVLDGKKLGYFTPTYKLLDGVYQECVSILEPIISRKNEHQFIEILDGKGRIDFWTLENELAGRSRKYHKIIVDEAAFTKNLWQKWTENLRATLTDYAGDAWFLSTPRGKNDFFKLFNRAKEDERWASWQMSTYTNPHIQASEIDDARHDLPELAFSQEYLAEFNDNIANPFGTQHIKQCIYPMSTNPVHCYGIDLAKSFDYTVIIGLDKAGNVCYFDRFQKDWKQTKDSILMLDRHAHILIDCTGVGDPVTEDLQKDFPNMEGVKFTAQSKQQLMEGLVQSIQTRRLSFPDGPITAELESFEYTYTANGVRYSAPTGFHDDCVVALALANRGLGRLSSYGNYHIV